MKSEKTIINGEKSKKQSFDCHKQGVITKELASSNSFSFGTFTYELI